MSCYAVATAQAAVSQEHLLTYLTSENLKEPLTAYLQARFPTATIDFSSAVRGSQWTIRQTTGLLGRYASLR